MELDDLIDNGDPREIKRALAVKMLEEGVQRKVIIRVLNISSQFISKWCSAYQQNGASALLLGYIGSEGYLTEKERREIHTYIKQYDTISVEELSKHIKINYGVTYSSPKSYHNLLKEAGMSWKKTEKVNPKRDENEVLLKRKEIKKKLHENADAIKSGELVVLMEDECHLLWGDICGYVWGKRGEQVPVLVSNQKERQTYYGAINYLTREFILKAYDAGNGKNTVDFIKLLRAKFSASRLLLIWDGASYHKYKETLEYLNEVNANLEKEDWPVECILFAPNAPDQNPVAVS